MLDLALSIEAMSSIGGAAPDPYPGAIVYDFQNGKYRETTSGAYGTNPAALSGWTGTPVIGANGLTVSDAGSSVKFNFTPAATGTMFIEFIVPASASNTRLIGTGTGGIAPLYLPDLTFIGSFSGGVALSQNGGAAFVAGAAAKAAVTWDATTRRMSAKGDAGFDKADTTPISGFTVMSPGSDNGTGSFLGSAIRRIIIYPDLKSATALRTLTA